MVSIRDMPNLQYWQNLRTLLDKAKENIPKQYRIGDTCLTELATIGGNFIHNTCK